MKNISTATQKYGFKRLLIYIFCFWVLVVIWKSFKLSIYEVLLVRNFDMLQVDVGTVKSYNLIYDCG